MLVAPFHSHFVAMHLILHSHHHRREKLKRQLATTRLRIFLTSALRAPVTARASDPAAKRMRRAGPAAAPQAAPPTTAAAGRGWDGGYGDSLMDGARVVRRFSAALPPQASFDVSSLRHPLDADTRFLFEDELRALGRAGEK